MSGVIANLYEEPVLTVESVIQKCTQIIEHKDLIAGAGRRMRSPMLNVFLGAGAEGHIREVQEAYSSCWSDHARNIKMLRGPYSREDIENAIVMSTQIEDRSFDATTVHTAWFWDIMDDQFDRYFECVKQKYAMPIAVGNQKVYFIFCSQKDTKSQEKTRNRLEQQLIPWAEETGNPLVILSDVTRAGMLNQRGLAENYRLAASLMLLLNSHYTINEKNLGTDMAFEFKKGGLWSASYYGCSKNFYDIVGVSLLTIIKRYRRMGQQKKEDFSQGTSVQSRLCGADKDYYDLLDEIFEEAILPKCCTDTLLWNDVPYTPQIAEQEAFMSGKNEHQGGFLGKLFRKQQREVSPEEAIASLQDFWNCCVQMYYVAPAKKWMDSSEGTRELKNCMYSRMATALNYDEMHTLLMQESQRVAAMDDKLETKLRRPAPALCKNVSQLLHLYALRKVKVEIYQTMIRLLADAMETLCKNAAGFDDLLARVQHSLREDYMDRSVVKAYGAYSEQLVDQNEEILTKYIRPCPDEGELLQQLEAAFAALMEKDLRRVYQKSLQEDLSFRIENGGKSIAINVISDCFRYQMEDAGRMPTYSTPSGTLYCIMNNAMDDFGDASIADEAIGNRFVVSRSDRIERLFLFRVEKKNIMFSNASE